MGEISWIKLRTDMFSDEKIQLIESMNDGESNVLTWIKLLCLAGNVSSRGELFLTKNTPFSVENLAKILRKTAKKTEKSLKILEEFGLISRDNKGTFLITNWEKHQNIDGIERIREQWRKGSQKYRKKQKSYDGHMTSNDGHKTEKRRIEKNIYSEESTEYGLANLLYNQIKNRDQKQKKPNFQSWAQNIDYLIRLDERSPEEIEKVILWCQSDDFWKNNILSTKKLREKFDQLYLKMNNSGSATDSLPQITEDEEGWK